MEQRAATNNVLPSGLWFFPLNLQVDADNSGYLDKNEVKKLGKLLGQTLTRTEVDEAMDAMQAADADVDLDGKVMQPGDGKVTFEEFERWWSMWKGNSTQTELLDLLSEVDTDDDGVVDLGEFITAVARKMETRHEPGRARSAPQMVRMALESVRDDIRAIYGTDVKPKSRIQRNHEIEDSIRSRCCFFRPDEIVKKGDKSAGVRFRKAWDLLQALLLW